MMGYLCLRYTSGVKGTLPGSKEHLPQIMRKVDFFIFLMSLEGRNSTTYVLGLFPGSKEQISAYTRNHQFFRDCKEIHISSTKGRVMQKKLNRFVCLCWVKGHRSKKHFLKYRIFDVFSEIEKLPKFLRLQNGVKKTFSRISRILKLIFYVKSCSDN